MTLPPPRPQTAPRCLRIVHLFPDLLSVYGDAGNIRALVVRATRRGVSVELTRLLADATHVPEADLFVIGGGQDSDQATVASRLRVIGDELVGRIADGAALLAVCGGYQSLGREYTNAAGSTTLGPGLFDIATVPGPGRLVGPVVAQLADPPGGVERSTIVGFENHGGRTLLGPGATALATVEIGSGNNGADSTEGILDMPGAGGLRGLRIGTYLHGPLLPRNPHIADALLAAALAATGQPTALEPLDDADEWRAHDAYIARCRQRPWTAHLPGPLRRVAEPARNLIGF